MSQHVEGPRKTFKAGTALEAFRRVKITEPTTSPKTIGYAGAGDPCIGVTEANVASGADCAIYPANAQGTRKMMASEAVTGGNATYAAANGKVAAIAGLTRSAVLRAGATNATVLADGASFSECDANTAITIGKTGGDLATATHIDVLLTYETIAA
jgi:hypothetical protein